MGLKERKVNLGCVMRRGRRYLAGALSCALLLGMILPTAAAADTNVNSATAAKPGEQPRIIIESNAVIDDFGDLTGYLEVALHVKTPVLDGVAETFRYLGVSLEYNSEILTPVDWTAPDGITTNDVDLSSTTAESYRDQVRFQTLKTNELTTAIAHVSGPCDGNKSPAKTGLFYIVSEASKPANLSEDTVVAVVRFRYDKSKYQPWEATADQWTDKTSPTWLVRFAPDAISGLAPDSSFVTQQLLYRSGNNAFYYTDDPATTVGYRVEVQGAPAGQEYLTNLLTMGNKETEKDREVRFTLRNLPTYDPAMRSNFATILYYDYTDRLMGVQTVLPGDARVAINTYVERNFIHPELRASAHKGDSNYTDSIDREYSYRGIYPSIDPDTGTTVDDGENYKLTFKLDYTFYKRKTVGTPTADGTGIEWTTTPMSSVTDPIEKDLPYINGWAVIDDLDDIENVWTTFGTGELGNCDPASGSFTTTGESSYFRFADFSRLKNGQVLYVKACYEPGTLLVPNSDYKVLSEAAAYLRYGSDSTNVGGVYSISYSYGRLNTDGYGVSRTRMPVTRLKYVPDVDGIGQTPFAVEVPVENLDVIEVEFTPSSAIMSMEYNLSDKKPYNSAYERTKTYNFWVASVRSKTGNELNVMENFNYQEFPIPDHLGSMGFVTEATLQQILQYGTEAVTTGNNSDYESVMTLYTVRDMNWRIDFTGTDVTTTSLTRMRRLVLDAIYVAINQGRVDANGNAVLGWHQIQYHILNANYVNSSTPITGGLHNGIPAESAAGAYPWCHIDDCAGGSIPITDVASLLEATYDYVVTPNPNAMNQLMGTLEFRKGISAVPFTGLSDFRTAIIKVVADLHGAGMSQADILNMDWKQVQYLLDRGGTSIPATVTEDYWWENGGIKRFNALSEMMTALHNVKYNSYDPSWTENITLTNLRDFLLRADEDGKEFISLAAFEAALNDTTNAEGTDVLTKLYASGYRGGMIGADETDTALAVQHVLLGNSYETPTNLWAMTNSGAISYWWITGAPTPTDYKSLLKLAWQVYVDGMPEDLLKEATVELVSNGGDDGTADFWLRGSESGQKFANDGALKAALKTAVDALQAGGVTDPDTVSWAEFQHVLLGNTYDANPDPSGSLYWWYRGGHKPIYDIPTLLEAAWNSYGGGSGNPPADTNDENAMDALPDDLDFINGLELATNPGIDVTDYLYLRTDADGTNFATVDAFKTALSNAINRVRTRGGSFVKGLTWIELQHIMLGNAYVQEGTLRGDPTIQYWWENGGSKSTGPNIPALVAELCGHINDAYASWDLTALQTFLNDNLDDLAFQDAGGNTYTGADAATVASILVDATGGGMGIIDIAWADPNVFPYFTEDFAIFDFTWNEIQYFLINGVLMSEEDGCPSYGWAPASLSLFSLRPLQTPQRPVTEETSETETSEDGLTQTTKHILTTRLADGSWTTVATTTVVTTTETLVITTTTVVTTTYDPAEDKVSTTTTSDTAVSQPEVPEEPVCTCGSEDGTHAEDCPFYVAPGDVGTDVPVDSKTCSCGSEDGTHAEDCPLYVAPEVPETPEEPVCICGSEDGTHTEDCPLYVAPGDVGTDDPVDPKTCTCGSEDGTHAEDCPLYDAHGDVGTDVPGGPGTCICGSEDGTHAEDCPLYVASQVSEQPEENLGDEETPKASEPESEEQPKETLKELPEENTEPTEGREDIMARLQKSEKWNRSGLGRLFYGTVWRSWPPVRTGQRGQLVSLGIMNVMEGGEDRG